MTPPSGRFRENAEIYEILRFRRQISHDEEVGVAGSSSDVTSGV